VIPCFPSGGWWCEDRTAGRAQGMLGRVSVSHKSADALGWAGLRSKWRDPTHLARSDLEQPIRTDQVCQPATW
jgi:hypothetical protein